MKRQLTLKASWYSVTASAACLKSRPKTDLQLFALKGQDICGNKLQQVGKTRRK